MIAGEIEGRVTDEDGAPVKDALVRLRPKGELDRLWPPTRTDDLGRYALRDLPVGTYRLESSAGDHSAELIIQVNDSSISRADLSLRR
jgi:protocatechuate 3,4-dioxygenase beta subunit